MSPAKSSQKSGTYEITTFTGIPAPTLVHLVLDARDDPVTQRKALAELAKLAPNRRNKHLIEALRQMVREPQLYQADITYSIVELLGTDPNPEATRAMIEVLPHVAHAQKKGTGPLTLDLRSYFYEALTTRQRDTDRVVWDEMLPQLDPDTLVDLLTDPAAQQLREFIDPEKLIEHLPREQRNQALKKLVLEGSVGQSFGALRRLMTGG